MLFSQKHKEIVKKSWKFHFFLTFLQFKKPVDKTILYSPYEISTIQAFAYKIQTFYLYCILDQPVF